MYTTRWCGYCVRAKALLDARGLEFDEVSLDDDPAFRQRLFDLTGSWSRDALRQSAAALSQNPPRTTRYEPLGSRLSE